MPNVTLNMGQSFTVEAPASILDAARNQGIVLEYSCRTGRCGVCKAPVVSGQTQLLRLEESLLPAEAADGIILTCCRTAVSDVILDIEPLSRLSNIEIKTMPSRIVSLERLAPDIMRVSLRTPPTSAMRFIPGQYIDVIAEGVRRSYSLANAPRDDMLLVLLVKRYQSGKMSDYFFERARTNDLVRIEGPFGTFFLRDGLPTNITFLATGTGIAPVIALLEELASDLARAHSRRISVFWGNSRAEHFCWDPGDLGFEVAFHHLLSTADDSWDGMRGYVQDAAISRGVDPDDTVVYACGSDSMITSAREALLAIGLPTKRFFADAFVSSN